MKPVSLILAALVVLLFGSHARADDGDDALRHFLSKSDVVLLGEFASEPEGVTKEAGVVSYGADFKITQLLKGKALGDRRVGGTIKVNVVRFEFEKEDRLPELKKGGRCILFLKCNDRQPTPSYRTVDVWFGVQRAWPTMAKSLARLAAEKPGPAAKAADEWEPTLAPGGFPVDFASPRAAMPARSCGVAPLGIAATVAGLHRTAGQPPAAPEPSIAVRKVRPGVDPHDLVIRDGKLYASGFRAGRVSALDLLTGKKLGETQLDGYERVVEEEVDGKKVPTKVAHHYCGGSVVIAGGKLFAEQCFSDLLLVIDPGSMRVVKRLPLGDGLLTATPDGKTVVCARSRKDEFHLIDAGTYEHTTVPYPEGGTGISAVAVSPDGRFVVLGIQRGGQPPGGKAVIENGNSFLAVYDLAQKKYAASVYMASSDTQSVSESVDALAYSPDSKMLYVGMFQATTGVRVIDPAKWKVLSDIRFEPNARNKHFPHTNPLGLVFYRGWLFVANRENQEVVVVDPATHKPAARLRFADGRHDFHCVLTEGDRVYLADQEAVYELDGWALARRLAVRADKSGHPPLGLVLKVR